MTHAVLNMTETVAAKMFAAVPARHNDDVVGKALAFQHAQDHHACARLSVVVFYRRIVKDCRPGVVGRACEFLVSAEVLKGGLDVVACCDRNARDRVFRAAIIQDVLKDFHDAWSAE